MKRTIAVAVAAIWCLPAFAQAPASTTDAAAKKAADNKARQEMVKGTTEAAATQHSAAPNRGPAPPSQKSAKATKDERLGGLQGSNNPATSQYGPAAGTAATKVDKTAPKTAKPDMADPTIQKAMQNQKQ